MDKTNIIREFIAEVEKRAEEKMLMTGKLEGSHYAAMQQVFKEWREIEQSNNPQ